LHLQQIFDAGLALLVDNQPKVESQSEFKAFVDEVTRRGYFADVTEGSPEYQQRWEKLKEKFMQARPMHSAAAASHGGAAQVSPVSADDELKQQQLRISQAESLKNEGNTLMVSKNYDAAIAAYSKAIELVDDNAVFYCNRAAALQHVGRYDDAVKDCNMSVKLKPDYAKAYSRLGAALSALRKWRQAADNGYAHAMRLEPANSEYRSNYEKAKAEADAAERGGSSAQPDLSQLFGGGGGGMPDIAAMLGGAGGMEGLAGLMNNPQMMSMAQNMMQNPAFMQMAQGFMGGMAPPPQPASESASAPAAASNFNPAQLAALADPETLQRLMQHPDVLAIRASDAEAASLLDQIQSQGIGAAMAHIGSPAFNRLLQVLMRIMPPPAASRAPPPGFI